MRDIILVVVFSGWFIYSFGRPHVGVLLWSWLAYMNPQRLTWGFAYSLPFTLLTALATLVSFLFSKDNKKIPISALSIFWVIFIIWVAVTTLTALNPGGAQELWIKTLKIQLMVFLTMALFNDEKRINQLIWIVAFSIGFFGIKGGVFTISHGGSFTVWGPAYSFIADNNELAVALLMVLPLMYYLFSRLTVSWHRKAIIICMVLMVVSIVGSQSRGAFLAIGAVGGYFWLQSDRKFLIAFWLSILVVALFLFLPDSWFDRMYTIENYEEDESAMSRIRAWTLAYHLANERLFGGGFGMWNIQTYAAFSPLYEPGQKAYVAHSIYFSILGEQGWPGLILFVTIFWLSWRTTSQLAKDYKNSTELKWVSDLARMLKISLLAYLTGGAFLSLAYFDLPWQIVAIVVLLKSIADNSPVHSGGVESDRNQVHFVRSGDD